MKTKISCDVFSFETIKELNIGNFVEHNGLLGYPLDWFTFLSVTSNPHLYKPLRITEGWLKEFGFLQYDDKRKQMYMKKANENVVYYDLRTNLLQLSGSESKTDWECFSIPNINYVHRMQNALNGLNII